MNKIAPCKDCENREIGCHGNCEKYKAWKAELQEMKKQIGKEKMKLYRLDGYTRKTRERLRKIGNHKLKNNPYS